MAVYADMAREQTDAGYVLAKSGCSTLFWVALLSQPYCNPTAITGGLAAQIWGTGWGNRLTLRVTLSAIPAPGASDARYQVV